MKTNYNYNCDQPLWENYRKSDSHIRLQVNMGHIIRLGTEADVIGRFDSSETAMKCLLLAGWRCTDEPMVFDNAPTQITGKE